MNEMADKKIIAICGSTRTSSVNLSLIHAIADMGRGAYDVDIYDEIANLPQFNPDLEPGNTPGAIAAFRHRLRAADYILISTPEYAMGVPGALKNAIDWTVSSCEFSKKPTALITASSLGHKGHASLLETLRVIEANITEDTQLVISYAKTKIGDNKINDANIEAQVISVMNALLQLPMVQTELY
ncbi:MAG: NAD(P)H-dependent oxidoreductase [Taibaiella sp.]|nr:NAD(P)H-dependent oxidoreductase [Taibaiella sp.]